MDEQLFYISVAMFADAEQFRFAARCALSQDKSEPGGKVTPCPKAAPSPIAAAIAVVFGASSAFGSAAEVARTIQRGRCSHRTGVSFLCIASS